MSPENFIYLVSFIAGGCESLVQLCYKQGKNEQRKLTDDPPYGQDL